MSQHDLPADDANNGERLLRTLDDEQVAPVAALWLWSDEDEHWQYVLAGGLLASEPDKAQERVAAAVARLGDPIDLDRIVVWPVDEPLLVAMGRKVQVGGVSRVRLGANVVDNEPVPPSLVYRLQIGGSEPRRRSHRSAPRTRIDRSEVVNDPASGGDQSEAGRSGAEEAARLEARRRRQAAKVKARAAKAEAAAARRSAKRGRHRSR